MEANYDYTPRVYRKLVFAATQCHSFAEGARALEELAHLKVPPKRLWRATQRVGEERAWELHQAASDYQQLPLPAQREPPGAVPPPQVACVQMDGGRFQVRPRDGGPDEAEPEPASRWRELKVGYLADLNSQPAEQDPCPQLPPTFADPGHLQQMAREIKGFTRGDSPELDAPQPSDDSAARAGSPQALVSSVVATTGNVAAFGPLLASAAYARGFHAAPRKAFVADGSEANWGVWRKYFSHYTPIVDFIHALMYVYAAALAGRRLTEGWQQYRQWAQWLWSGAVEQVIAALEARQQELGTPEPHEAGTPRAQVAETLGYLRNQRTRMRYAEYRRQGLPITSTWIESTIKRINRRMKGTEKFWDQGAEALLSLVADQLSQTPASDHFWQRRNAHIMACYKQSA